jgi:parvulin-like peptidyl-prolyl isomerase
MIDTRLLGKAAERARLTASKEEIEKTIADIAKQNGQTVAELWQLVAREGYDEVDYRRRIGEQIVAWRLASLEAHKRIPDMSKLESDEQQRRVAATMKTLVGELRSAAHIEERL